MRMSHRLRLASAERNARRRSRYVSPSAWAGPGSGRTASSRWGRRCQAVHSPLMAPAVRTSRTGTATERTPRRQLLVRVVQVNWAHVGKITGSEKTSDR